MDPPNSPFAKGGQGGFLGLIVDQSKNYSFGCGFAALCPLWPDYFNTAFFKVFFSTRSITGS
jgi:hypothetical protein